MSDEWLLPIRFPSVTYSHADGRKTPISGPPDARVTYFYALIGWPISTWAHIDRAHFECLHLLIGVDETKSATIYYRFITQSERFGLTRDLMEITPLSIETMREWKSICSEITKESPIRNMLAHQPSVWTIGLSANGGEPELNYSTDLIVQTEDKELLRGAKTKRVLTLDELRAHAMSVFSIMERIDRFVETLEGQPQERLRSSGPKFLDPLDRYNGDPQFRRALHKLLASLLIVARRKAQV